jgi:adenosylhomocysteinase
VNTGRLKIEWARQYMPVLASIRREFESGRPLESRTVGMALHVEAKTAVLVETLAAAGAEVHITGCNPLSTQDDVAAALNEVPRVHCYAKRGATVEEYYRGIGRVLDARPSITIDDGMDLIYTLHTKRRDLLDGVTGGSEETTTGVHRLKAMAAAGALAFPVLAVNDTPMKRHFDNVHGTGESALASLMITTNVLLAGKNLVIAGYGFCGKGLARKAAGLGARVIITEVDPGSALQAHMDGFSVMSMEEAARVGHIFITATGNIGVITERHFALMREGAILANAGHFNVEVDRRWLEENADSVIRRDGIDSYRFGDRALHLLAEGRLVNLATPKAMGHPIEVMDLSFSLQALCTRYIAERGRDLAPGVHEVPQEIDRAVALRKLDTLGLSIDLLTAEQAEYQKSWGEGT